MSCREEVGTLCGTCHFGTANTTPLFSISRHLAPFGKLGWKVITLKDLFQSSAPVHLWAFERSRIVDPTSQYFLGGLGLMACGRHGLSIEEDGDYHMCLVEGLNRKAFKEAGM
jgi:hypothetical protein